MQNCVQKKKGFVQLRDPEAEAFGALIAILLWPHLSWKVGTNTSKLGQQCPLVDMCRSASESPQSSDSTTNKARQASFTVGSPEVSHHLHLRTPELCNYY